MKIAIINKSDSIGGAAVVSRRLMEALREQGVDARMIVVEKLTDSPFVLPAASPLHAKIPFLAERLQIFADNGFDRKTLFKIDTAAFGLPLWRHPFVKEADAVLLNWTNQGMLSLRGVRKILGLGKPVVWTMHDMWCMTGVCHHAGDCRRFLGQCGDCPLLNDKKSPADISHKTWRLKRALYEMTGKIGFVAVSRWLADKARESSLLKDASVSMIPNTFTPQGGQSKLRSRQDDEIRIVFGAARIDDPVKNLPALVEMTKALRRNHPDIAGKARLITFGNIKNEGAAAGMAIPHTHLGPLQGEDKIREVYEGADILLSSSSYETFGATLVEAQAYGCIPVSFSQGGQTDIIDHLTTGYLADYEPDPAIGGARLAEGVAWAADMLSDSAKSNLIQKRMRENVATRFSAEAVATAYLRLVDSLH